MTKKIEGTPEAWEQGLLGADEKHVVAASPEHSEAIDKALGLRMISIRLPIYLIEDFKKIAAIKGDVSYQPFMRQVLTRFAERELQLIAEGEAE